MEILEVIDKIEEIIKNETLKEDEDNAETEERSTKNTVKELITLVLHFILNILRIPLNLIATYLRKEIVSAIKKDAKLYTLIMAIMAVLLIFFSVMWLFVSVAVAVYFHEQGSSVLISIVYSIGFQLISFMLMGLIALIASKNIKSLKMLKRLK